MTAKQIHQTHRNNLRSRTSSSCWAVGRRFGLMTRTLLIKAWKPTVLKSNIKYLISLTLSLFKLAVS